ncbi:hypothetical protein GWM34_01813, partial [Candida africana]
MEPSQTIQPSQPSQTTRTPEQPLWFYLAYNLLIPSLLVIVVHYNYELKPHQDFIFMLLYIDCALQRLRQDKDY